LKTEPLTLIVLLFGFGALATILAIGLELAFMPQGALFLAGVFEEPSKILGVYYIATRKRFHKEFNGPMDGLVWGAAAGAGFAIVESTEYLVAPLIRGQLGIPGASTLIVVSLLLRNFSGPMHMVWTGIVAWWLGLVKASRGRFTGRDLIPGLFVAIVLHGLWNALDLVSLIILLPIYVYLFRKLAKEAHREELAWGYQSIQVPKLHRGIIK
jgi:RsiW-degrading membrane proteinase PrsW (M82 family)